MDLFCMFLILCLIYFIYYNVFEVNVEGMTDLTKMVPLIQICKKDPNKPVCKNLRVAIKRSKPLIKKAFKNYECDKNRNHPKCKLVVSIMKFVKGEEDMATCPEKLKKMSNMVKRCDRMCKSKIGDLSKELKEKGGESNGIEELKVKCENEKVEIQQDFEKKIEENKKELEEKEKELEKLRKKSWCLSDLMSND